MINLSALKANIDLEIEASKKESPDTFRCGMLLAEIVSEALEQQIVSDVVKVVRCKDCKYFRRWNDGSTTCLFWTEQWDMVAEPNGFCSYAERIEDNE